MLLAVETRTVIDQLSLALMGLFGKFVLFMTLKSRLYSSGNC